MERLSCHVKEYEWGKRGADSEVARLFAAGHKHFRIDEQKPYAEASSVVKKMSRSSGHRKGSRGTWLGI